MRPSIQDALAALTETTEESGKDPSRHLLDTDPLQWDNRTTIESIASICPQVKTNVRMAVKFRRRDPCSTGHLTVHRKSEALAFAGENKKAQSDLGPG